MANPLAALAVLLALAVPVAAALVSAARSGAPVGEDALVLKIGSKNSVEKQCERNADHYGYTGLERQAHIENCKKTLGAFSDKKKGVGQP